jgi:hypothetical protein
LSNNNLTVAIAVEINLEEKEFACSGLNRKETPIGRSPYGKSLSREQT